MAKFRFMSSNLTQAAWYIYFITLFFYIRKMHGTPLQIHGRTPLQIHDRLVASPSGKCCDFCILGVCSRRVCAQLKRKQPLQVWILESFVWIDRYYGIFYLKLGSQLKKRESLPWSKIYLNTSWYFPIQTSPKWEITQSWILPVAQLLLRVPRESHGVDKRG
jgi:hypothetical protein